MSIKGYRLIGWTLALIFAGVGLLFLLTPGGVVSFFNGIARGMGMSSSPNVGMNFYVALAAAYMYLVTLLAVMMALHPGEKLYPLLLSHGKAASAVLSLGLFSGHGPYLIFLVNAAADGGLALLAIWLYRTAAGRTRV